MSKSLSELTANINIASSGLTKDSETNTNTTSSPETTDIVVSEPLPDTSDTVVVAPKRLVFDAEIIRHISAYVTYRAIKQIESRGGVFQQFQLEEEIQDQVNDFMEFIEHHNSLDV